jgi:hypothetical protein
MRRIQGFEDSSEVLEKWQKGLVVFEETLIEFFPGR